ncbi:MAG: type III secretion system chaperone [Gammaproteobacteria bacterium]
MNIRDVLAELGHQMGLKVSLNDQGVCRLVFDQRFTVDIEASPDNDTVHLYSVLCPIPSDGKERFYEQLLEANLFGGGTGGAWFALDSLHNEVLLNRTLNMATTDYQDFVGVLESFVNHLESWDGKLARGELNRPDHAATVDFDASSVLDSLIRA